MLEKAEMAAKAMARLNPTNLKGSPVRTMWFQTDPLLRKTSVGNLFVKNLCAFIKGRELQAIFSTFGTILSCKVPEENGKSKGFGFVQFDTEKSAMAAIDVLNGAEIKGKKLSVSKFIKKSERAHDEQNFTNRYAKNLGDNMTQDLLREQFSQFGKVSNVAIMKGW